MAIVQGYRKAASPRRGQIHKKFVIFRVIEKTLNGNIEIKPQNQTKILTERGRYISSSWIKRGSGGTKPRCWLRFCGKKSSYSSRGLLGPVAALFCFYCFIGTIFDNGEVLKKVRAFLVTMRELATKMHGKAKS